MDQFTIILGLVALRLIYGWIRTMVREYQENPTGESFVTWKRFGTPLLLVLVLGIPITVIQLWLPEEALISSNQPLWFTIAISGFATAIWGWYLLRIDIYEQERWYHIAAVFFLAVGSTYSCLYVYDFIHSLGFVHQTDPFQDFIYCVFGIGLIEETAKFVPVLIILGLTKAINEPYDYLLYASLAALGFAFTENVLYLDRFGLEIIHTRSYYATVAHLTFSSFVAYGFLLAKYRFHHWSPAGRWGLRVGFFIIAIFSHGFYDFWLLNDMVSDYRGLTMLFFLFSIHLWFVMKNNAVNVSNFYQERIKLDTTLLRNHLVVGFSLIFMIAYVWVGLTRGQGPLNSFLKEGLLVNGLLVLYLVVQLTRYRIRQGRWTPLLQPTLHFFIPSLRNPPEEKSD